MRRSLCCKFHFPKYTSASSACENPVCVTQFWMRKMEWKCKTWFCVTITTILAFFLALLFVVTTSSSSREKWPTCVLQGIQRRLLLLPVDYNKAKKRGYFFTLEISAETRWRKLRTKGERNLRKNVWKLRKKYFTLLKYSKIHFIFRVKTMYYNYSVVVTLR